ncbi:MAG: hypothetical protein K6D97_08820, partial [Clostridia bacterium]|nr:hypothetical protein [Clostridia bacterium]
MRNAFYASSKNASDHTNDNVIISFLEEQWKCFHAHVLIRNSEVFQEIVDHYIQFHSSDGDSERCKSDLETHKALWDKYTVKNLITTRKETRNPYVSLGIAATISVAMMNYSDNYFYIGEAEAKKVLFLCLEVFDYEDIEFIPDDYYKETDNFRKLLFSALYSVLMFLYPATNSNRQREKNYSREKINIANVIRSDVNSKLFSAFQNVAEAKSLAENLWEAVKSNHQCFALPYEESFGLAESYLIPRITANKKIGILSCEKGQPIRSLVEGKSGCGKSTLIRMIAQSCCNYNSDNYTEFEEMLDFQKRMWPIIIDCKDMRLEDLDSGIIKYGLDQMKANADSAGYRISQYHYDECKEYLMAFCYHKIM